MRSMQQQRGNLGTISPFAYRHRETKINLCRGGKNNQYVTCIPVYILVTSRSLLLRMRHVPDKSYRENQSTHFMFSNFFFENHAVYYTLWKIIVEPDTPVVTEWRMRIAWCITTNTHLEYVTHCFSTATVVVRTRFNVTLHIHCVSCYFYLR